MAVLIGNADNRLVGGVLGMYNADTITGVSGTSAGVVGLAGTSDTTDNWNGNVESEGQPVTAAVLGAMPVISQGIAPAWSSIGFLAGGPGVGASGESMANDGVQGKSHDQKHSGVVGTNDAGGFGVLAQSNTGTGLVATSDRGQGISAFSNNDIGLFVKGATFGAVLNGAVVVNKGDNPTDPNIPPSDINGSLVINEGSLFLNKGDVFVSGNLTMRNGGDVILADCAEEFACSAESGVIEAGSVVAVDDTGMIRPCSRAYDRRAIGVVSGAGVFRPAIVLDRDDSAGNRVPVALVGKVCCKVDAQYGSVEVGDLLTTSPTCGHAMRVSDPMSALGAVVGKALQPLGQGQGLIPVLVTLQ
jgi:hypothetical protein